MEGQLPNIYQLVACAQLLGGPTPGEPPSPTGDDCDGDDEPSALLALGKAHPAWSDLPLPRGAQHKEEASKLQLRRLRRYLVSLGAQQDVVDGWTTETKWR